MRNGRYCGLIEIALLRIEYCITMWYSMCMKILSTKWFRRWSKKAKLRNNDLLEAINNLESGLSTANLGNHLFKIRVKRTGGGKRSGFRTIVVYQENDKAIFLYGFGKNEKDNIDKHELRYFKKLGADLLALDENQIRQFIAQKTLFDIKVTE